MSIDGFPFDSDPVYDDAGIYAGLVRTTTGRAWECGECLVDGAGGARALLAHVAEEHA